MVWPFPVAGARVEIAYRELLLAVDGTHQQRQLIGDPAHLPRPWEPATCTESELRRQVWGWLDNVALWVNLEHTWEPAAAIPACWPSHPHIVHELAVLADQRRRAGQAVTSDLLEEWHRYTLPAFLDRLRTRTRDLCDDGHQPWPGRSRHRRYLSHDSQRHRDDHIEDDLDGAAGDAAQVSRSEVARRPAYFAVVDLETGELEPDP